MGDEVDTLKVVNFRPYKPTRGRTDDRKQHGELIRSMTIDLVALYARCSNGRGYSLDSVPRRVLTKLSKGLHNSGFDNAEHDYICRVGDKIRNPEGILYEIRERLGNGTFGQVLKCYPSCGGPPIALKIIKNKPAYYHQALVEVRILQMLNQDFDADDEKRIVRMLDFFVYRKHLCIAFELLSVNLYEVLRQNSFKGVSMALIRVLTEQVLKAMRCLREALVIHCDLKPENVLLGNMQHTKIKLIDFGSACFEKHSVYSYIQSRFYRSPEVLLGLPYTSAIDMWSLGCICAELFLGLPLFPGHSEYDQVFRIVNVMGLPPASMLELGENTKRYFCAVEEQPVSTENPAEQGAERPPLPKGDETEDEPERGNGREHSAALSPASLREGHPCAETQQNLPRHAQTTLENDTSLLPQPVGDDNHVTRDSAEEPQSSPTAAAARLLTAQTTPGLRRSESLLELLKRKLNMQATSVDDSAGGSHQSASSQGSLTKSQGCSREGQATSETCLSEGSALSTAPDVSELSGCRRGSMSSDELLLRQTSSDGRAEHRASGSSDGGKTKAAASNETGCSQHGRRGCSGRKAPQRSWRLKTLEEFEDDEQKKEPTRSKYFNFKSLEHMIEVVPYKEEQSQRALKIEQERRSCFLQFLNGILQLNPDERWTAKQASAHPFITQARHDPGFTPPPDKPVPSFAVAVATPGNAQVPRLDPKAMGPFGGAYTGGGSARTSQENAILESSSGNGTDGNQPRSAPATTRGVVPAGQVRAGRCEAEREPEAPEESNPESWAETWRPPLDKMSEDFFRRVAGYRNRRPLSSDHGSHRTGSPQQPSHGAMSVRTGTSHCSSASSTGSTPPGGRGRRGITPPCSPLSAGGPAVKNHNVAFAQESKAASGPAASSRTQVSVSTGTPASSPHGSAISAPGGAVASNALPIQTPHRGTGHPSTVGQQHRAASSREGSRGSSPWHLPSPTSEMSTVSDNNRGSSQMSGSDSCGENILLLNECRPLFEDSHSDTGPNWPRSTQHSDSSDCTSPRSNDATEHARLEEERCNTKDPQHALWENIKSEISRTGLTRRLDITQSPGVVGAMGNFREAMGMKETGPVIPHGLGARAISSMMTSHPAEYDNSPPAASAGCSTTSAGSGHGSCNVAPRTSNNPEGSNHPGLGSTIGPHHNSRKKGRSQQSGH